MPPIFHRQIRSVKSSVCFRWKITHHRSARQSFPDGFPFLRFFPHTADVRTPSDRYCSSPSPPGFREVPPDAEIHHRLLPAGSRDRQKSEAGMPVSVFPEFVSPSPRLPEPEVLLHPRSDHTLSDHWFPRPHSVHSTEDPASTVPDGPFLPGRSPAPDDTGS